MNWFKFFRLANTSKKRPLSKKARSARQSLRLETLEERDVPAVPTVTSVSPSTGGQLTTNIVVQFSEDVLGANDPSNFRIFAADGTPINIGGGGLTYDNINFRTTITKASLTAGGGTLTAGTYSLFLRGDKIFSVSTNDPLARPGELVVANGGRNSISTVSLTGNGLGAVSTVPLPAQGSTPYAPSVVAAKDVNNDGLTDLIVASSGQNNVNIYLGNSTGSFSTSPDLILDLPTNATPSAMLVTDFNKDNKPDIVVANGGINTGNVSVFLNLNSVSTELAFTGAVNSTISGVLGLTSLVTGDFNKDGRADLALTSANAVSNNYNAYIVTGNDDGSFNFSTTTTVVVGTAAITGPPAVPATGVNTPTGLAVGRFNNDNFDDLAVSGTNNNITVLTNTTASAGATPTFTSAFVVSNASTASIATGAVAVGAGAKTQDIVATTTGGQLLLFVNNGTGGFTLAGPLSAGTGITTPTNITVRDLTGDGKPELVYVNNAAAGGLAVHAPVQAGKIASAVGTAATPITITSTGHGLESGQTITITGVAGFPALTGSYVITKVDLNTFTLNGTTGTVGTATVNTGVWIATPRLITGAAAAMGNGTGPIVITSFKHGLRTGQQITISGVGGNTNANGTFFINVTDADHFELIGTTQNAPYTSGGTFNLPVYSTGASTLSLALGDFTGDGILDVVTANKTDNTSGTISYYQGSGTAGVGDGTFLAATSLPLAKTTALPVDVTSGDLNGDGIPDLVAVDAFSTGGKFGTQNNQVNILFGQAAGGYSAATALSTAASPPITNSRLPVSVALGDIDKDGDLDIVVASQLDNNVAVYLNNGMGSFTRQANRNVGTTPTQVVLADVNNDKVLDLLVAHNPSSTSGGQTRGVSVALGNGNGSFQNPTEVYPTGFGFTPPRASGIAVGDFNRDGNIDFVVTDDQSAGKVRFALGKGTGSFDTTFFPDAAVGSNPTAVVVADFNADGYVDIATASRNDSTSDNVSVLLNNTGTGFQSAINSTVPTGTPLRSLQAVNVNLDPFIDLVVTSQSYPTTTSPPLPTPTPTSPINNTHVLFGVGDGSFNTDVDDYNVTGTGTTTPLPSDVGIVSDPFKILSTFSVGGTIVSVNLVRNGNFESRDLTGEQGNLTGWTSYRLTDTTRGSAGQWLAQTGTSSPLSLTTVTSPIGRYQAMLDQQNLQPYQGNFNPNPDDAYAGTNVLYQDVTIPAASTSVRLSMRLYLKSSGPWSDPAGNPQLDYRTGAANQQVRVDIMSTSGSILDVDAGVKFPIYQTQFGDPTTATISFSNIDLSQFAGQTIRLRIASTNNQGKLIVGVDNVSIRAVFADSTDPIIDSLSLRNPTFLSTPSTLEQSNDPTIVGQVRDNGSINNISQIIFDLANNGFGSSDDAIITTLDPNGFFTFSPTSLLPGVVTVPVRVIDGAGNFVDQKYQFILQSPSLTNWQATGPGPIDVSAAGFDYSTVSGKISGIAVDPTDPSGNTFYIGSSNGGVWKTTNGGHDWVAQTDNVTDLTGQRINVPVGGLTLGVQTSSGQRVIYAATGLDDNAFTSRTSVGVLRSLDDGRSWSVLGGATLAGNGIFTGARVSKIVLDPNDPNTVYVAVTSWDTPGKAPALFKTTNGMAANPANVTWTNVLDPANMFNPPVGATPAVALGAAYATLASVTDVLVDPFNPNRIIIGLGNIGQRTADDSAGVWKSIDGGSTWNKIVGGDNPLVPKNKIFGDPTVTAERGRNIGRITLAQGNGRVGDERFVYVLMSNTNGGDLGLYKTSDNLLNFTKVMLRQPGLGHARFTESYVDITLLGSEGLTVGALSVDPSNPNVVYVGGSRRGGTSATHAIIHVDTGNMRDATYSIPFGLPGAGTIPNDGDDIDKGEEALRAGQNKLSGHYPNRTDANGNIIAGNVTYTGEGVYWYDIEQDQASDVGFARRLPPVIHRLAFDTQGRLLIGTENGIFRAVPLGFGYDFNSSFAGILAGTGGGGGAVFNPPGMTVTELNGNLQITDLTSVAIDPTSRGQYYISASGVGSAITGDAGRDWATIGLTGPTLTGIGNVGIPNAFQVLTANLAPDAPPDATTTLYRVWQFGGRVSGVSTAIPEVSSDAGSSFSTTNSAGISSQDNAGLAPILAINKNKVNVNGVFYDELLFGTDKVYLTQTGGNVWDAISGRLSPTGFVSALAFSAVAGEYWAGTTDGKVFLKRANGVFTDVTNNLSALLGTAAFSDVNGITVDPRNANVVYVMMGTPNGVASVYRSVDRGASWAPVGGGLPAAASYTLVIDPRSSTGALNGRFYLGTDRGVFTSVDNGNTWVTMGRGLPAAPVVNLVFNPDLEILAAATQGRGVFTLSTARSGPAVTSATPNTVINDNAGLSSINVNFNTPVDPRTFNADSDTAARVGVASGVVGSTAYKTGRIQELEQQYRRRAATQTIITGALATFNSGPNGELEWTARLVASDYYYNNVAGATPASWVEQVYQDLLGRTSLGDPDVPRILGLLNGATGAQATTVRLSVARQLIGINASGVNFPQALEFQTRLAESLFNRYLGANVPLGTAPTGVFANAINAVITSLQARRPYATVFSEILASSTAYQKFGSDYALPAGVTANTVALAGLSGAKNTAYADSKAPASLPDNLIPDLIVAGSDDNLYVFKGKAGGGYNPTPLVLALPAGADASQIAVGYFNNDNKLDIAVANSGLTGAGGVSVFLNTTASPSGPLTFGPRTNLDAGNNPVGIVVADLDGDNKADIAVANRALDNSPTPRYTANVLLGNGDGTFQTASPFKVGDAVPNAAELVGPTGIAVGNVVGGSPLDLVLSGDNGVVVLTNTSTTGTPAFALLGSRLTNTATTSVAVGNLDTDIDLDIAATSDTANGEVLVFQNDNAGDTFTASTVLVGENPRSLKLGDLNGDGKLDLVVANNTLGGGVSILYNATQSAAPAVDIITFKNPVSYPVTGNQPGSIALGDTNQDGLLDVAIGYDSSEFVSLLTGRQQGIMQTPTDRTWATWLYRSLINRAPTAAERSALEASLNAGYLVSLVTPDGTAAPLSVTPADSSNQVYTITFAPQLLEGTYKLVIGPNSKGVNLKDFTDLNGTYVNTGNPMNQDRDATNGENPGDRSTTLFAVNTSDDGRFISAIVRDLQGTTAGGGRPAGSNEFVALNNIIEPALRAAITTIATNNAKAAEATTALVNALYARYGVSPTGTEVSTATSQLMAGQITARDLVARILASTAYFNLAQMINTNPAAVTPNEKWVDQIYQDLVNIPGTVAAAPNFAAKVAALDSNAKTRLQIATNAVYSDAALRQAVTDYFQMFLGRTPVRNADPALDETTSFGGKNFTALLAQKAAAGVVSADQRLIAALVSSPEYFRVIGNSDFEWVRQLFLKVRGRSSIDTDPVTGTEFNALLNGLLTKYSAARLTALQSVTGNQEFRNRFYTDYITQLLPTHTTITAADLAAQEAVYQANNQRFEANVANIVSGAEYFPLIGGGSSNSAWLDKVYQALLGRSTTNDPTATKRLQTLNAATTTSQLVTARFNVALQILNSTEYRQILVTSFFNFYLDRNGMISTAERDAFVNQLIAGNRQQVIIRSMLVSTEYFRLVT